MVLGKGYPNLNKTQTRGLNTPIITSKMKASFLVKSFGNNVFQLSLDSFQKELFNVNEKLRLNHNLKDKIILQFFIHKNKLLLKSDIKILHIK